MIGMPTGQEKRASHSPGPWEVYDKDPGHVGAPDGHICTPEGETREVVLANAHLIAAAPELLASLKRIVDTYGIDLHSGSELCEMVAAAIAKAEGRS
jgi:hypothetical protein